MKWLSEQMCFRANPFPIVAFPELQSLHFYAKVKFWYQLEDNSIRNNFGPSVQRAFHMGVRGPPGARPHRAYGNRCIS